MSIINRIGNLAKGKWLVSTRPDAHDAAHEAGLERELATTPRPKAASLRRDPPPQEAAPPEPPSTPIELDGDGHVKRTL